VADALRDDHGVDVDGWQLYIAQVSPNGRAFAGRSPSARCAPGARRRAC
jgi:hypothetical protein